MISRAKHQIFALEGAVTRAMLQRGITLDHSLSEASVNRVGVIEFQRLLREV
jgi:hypothetical protein